MRKTWILTVAAVAAFAFSAWPQVPGIITTHGWVTSDGTNFNGNGEFKFALVDGAGSVSHWSNDGTSVNGSEPIREVPLPVNDGLFTVGLGNTNLPHMTTIPPDVFTNADVWLRIWFNDGESGFVQLSPDQQITSVGYAMMSALVPDGSITAAKIASGAIEASHLAEGAITATELADGSVTTPKLADGAVTAAKVAADAIGSDQVQDNALTSEDIADTLTLETLNLGGTSWDGTLRLFSQPTGGGGGIVNPGGSPRGYLEADDLGSELALYLGNGPTGAVLSSRSPGGRLRLWDGLGTLSTFLGTTLGGGDLNLFQINGQPGIQLNGDRATYSNRGSAGGEITVHNAGGAVGLLLDGDYSSAGRIEVRQANGTPYVDIFGLGAFNGGEVRVKDASGGTTIQMLGADSDVDGGGRIIVNQGDGDIGAILYGSAPDNGAGALSLRNTRGDPRLRLYGGPESGSWSLYNAQGYLNVWAYSYDDEEGVVSVRNKTGNETIYLWGRDSADANGGQIGLKESDGTETLTLQASEVAGNGAQIVLRKSDGTSTIVLDADQGGEGRITTQVLQITGGSDLSEQFEVKPLGATPEPGMLVCIDPEQPGHLVPSTRAYDRTVAGIISGAGGVKPGMLMGQTGSIADGKHPVALTGRVYCQANAANGAIQPGDLITTSDQPGQGMKVTDHAKAQGAIIGKAMTGLESGEGLVLVLVSLN